MGNTAPGMVNNFFPVWGAVLIGGKSSRMGQPKHLIKSRGKTWLESIVSTLDKKVEKVVISGKGSVPASLEKLQVLRDASGLRGPLAGVLSLLRWRPDVSWIVTACDQPDIFPDAIDWLLAQRSPDTIAILPDLQGNGQLEPLLAFYDCRCRGYIEEIAATGDLRLSKLAGRPGVKTPQPPIHLLSSWRNINTPEERERLS